MKKLLYILTIVVSGLSSILTACSDEDMVKQNSLNIKEGVPVTVSIGFKTSEQKIQSRVEQSAETESNVSSLYIFVFNSDGSVDYKGSVARTDREQNKVGTFSVTTGVNKKIVAVANASTTLMRNLLDVQNETELKALTETMNSGNLNRNTFLMTCSYSISIDENGYIYDEENNNTQITNLLLERADAKITFQIELGNNITDEEEGVDPNSLKNFTFSPIGFTVYNLPNSTNVLAQETDCETNYSNGSDDFDSSDSESEDGISFNFYMFESHKDISSNDNKYITQICEDANSVDYLYALREKKDINGNFKYAPSNATYVVFTGTLSYEREKNGVQQWVNASVSYTVFLGETGNTEADYVNPVKINNYTVNRNTHYIYKITITGVNSIRVEVIEKKEERPGYEGDVIIAGNRVESMDSHYGRALFYLTRDEVKEGLSWVIQTPFDNGIKLNSATSTNLKDYKWILFAINTEFGIDEADGIESPAGDGAKVNMVKFPGYGAYDGGGSTTTSNDRAYSDEGNSNENVLQRGNWKSTLANTNSDNFYADYQNYVSEKACLRDINQLLNHLRVEANKSDLQPGDYITAFIDEYIYHYDPRIEEYIDPEALDPNTADGERRLKLWKEVVNGTDRLMHICTGDIAYSEDKNSSWTESVVTFSQVPVYTMYNEKATNLNSAWGTETIIEGGKLVAIPKSDPNNAVAAHDGYFSSGGTRYENSMNNGRINTLMFFVNSNGRTAGKKWGDVLNRTDWTLNNDNGDELKDDYQDIWHACMIRNRDLNGNNIIDPEEVRWFLASIDELTDLWIGEDALPASAKLYQGTGEERSHIASSSYNTNINWPPADSYKNPFVIWAEEGASRGSWSGSYGTNGNEYYYRCIRYLGLGLDNFSDTPDSYAEYNNGHIDVTYLSDKAKRTVHDNGWELPYHEERGNDDMNKPYSEGFDVYSSVTGQSLYWSGNNGFENRLNYQGESELCPDGYRVPNQRELMLMYTRMNLTGNLWCSTHFSFNSASWANNQRPGFAYNYPNMTLVNLGDVLGTGSNVQNSIRCVRDVVE